MSTLTPSKYQQRIFDFIEEESGSGVIEAVAGSGKTSTCIMALQRISPKKKVIFLAFNKEIANELKERAPVFVECLTTHSLGIRTMGSAVGKVNVVDTKISDILDKLVEMGKVEEFFVRENRYTIKRLVALAKAEGIVPSTLKDKSIQGILPDTDEAWNDLILHYDIDIGKEDMTEEKVKELQAYIIRVVRAVLVMSLRNESEIDFDDMLYVPVVRNLPFRKYDYIFIDEAQDLSAIQRAMLSRMMGPSSRLIAVGDGRQAIYSFRGADADSLENIANEFDCTKMPLSITYRCPRRVVAEAKKIVPHIEAAPNAIEGTVITKEMASIHDFKPGHLVVCRATAPIVKLAYKLITNKIPANIMGREIGKGLTSLIRRLKADDVDDLRDKLEEWKIKEVAKLLKVDKDADLTRIEDKYDCILNFIAAVPTDSVRELSQEIESVFRDEVKGTAKQKRASSVTLGTIHRCKGLESEVVWFLDPWMLPSKYAKKDHQITQEHNLIYVAVTRAMRDLYYIASDKIIVPGQQGRERGRDFSAPKVSIVTRSMTEKEIGDMVEDMVPPPGDGDVGEEGDWE